MEHHPHCDNCAVTFRLLICVFLGLVSGKTTHPSLQATLLTGFFRPRERLVVKGTGSLVEKDWSQSLFRENKRVSNRTMINVTVLRLG